MLISSQDKQITFEPIPKAESVAPVHNGNGRSRKKRKVHVLEEDDEEEQEQDQAEGTSQASRLQANTSAQVETTDLTHLEHAEDIDALPPVPQVKEEQADDDPQLLHGSDGFPGFPALGQEDDEDVKPDGKPTLRVSYNGFSSVRRLHALSSSY
jgi:Asp-tRNA(Asn)/Glu-tRNA(Gln) amidotransferase A subunit family amidase